MTDFHDEIPHLTGGAAAKTKPKAAADKSAKAKPKPKAAADKSAKATPKAAADKSAKTKTKTEAKTKTKAKAGGGQVGGEAEEPKRTFTVVSSDIGKSGGRYYALTPMQAGTKAGRQLFHSVDKSDSEFARYRGANKIQFTIRETTRKAGAMSNRPVYTYEVMRKKKDNPREVQFTTKDANGNTKKSSVSYKWDYTVRKAEPKA